MKTLAFNFDKHAIHFEMENGNVMVNATEMAKIYGKKVENFKRNEQSKAFIQACIKSANSRFLLVEKEEDLIVSIQKSGTWMHRVLALKFAAWLDPEFEVWVFERIDQLLYNHYKDHEESLKKSAERRNEIDSLKVKLMQHEEFQKLEMLELQERQAAYRRGKENRDQLDLFRQSYN